MDIEQQIFDSIEKDISLSEKMLLLLIKKKNALEKFDSVAIENLVPEIDDTIISIEQNQGHRNQLLQKINLPNNNKGIKSFIKSVKNKSIKIKFSKHLETLENILQELTQLNKINEKVIKYNHMQVNQRINQLYGTSGQTTYSEDAKHEGDIGSRVRGKI